MPRVPKKKVEEVVEEKGMVECPECDGTGNESCETCSGSGEVEDE